MPRLLTRTAAGTPVAESSCDCGSTGCQPLDVAYDRFAAPGWLFIALSPKEAGAPAGQVLAVRDDDLTAQYLVHRDARGEFAPLELDVLPATRPEEAP